MLRSPRLRTLRRVAPLVVAAALAGTALAPAVPRAGAAPIADLQQQAEELAAQIDANAERAAELSEQVKFAVDRLDEANATVADAQARIEAAHAEIDRLKGVVRAQAAAAYKGATGADRVSVFSVKPGQANRVRHYSDAANQEDDTAMSQLAQARDAYQDVQAQAEAAAREAEAQKAQLEATRAEFQQQNAELEANLAKVKGEIAELVAQAEAARRAAEQPKPTPQTVQAGGTTFDPSTIPAASGKGAIVVAYAMAQLGKPYVYAGSGPDSFDCSGLTMAAWAQAGVSMGHNSESQYASFPRVPMDALAPGDIVWAPGHVGIYVGGGAVIHAPHSGDVVRYIDVDYFRGAVRPG